MPHSHHSHSGQFCAHAKNTLEEMVKAAVARGMHVFALTEHMPREMEDLYPEEVTSQQTAEGLVKLMDDFYVEAIRLRDVYASQLSILIGFEGEWIRPSTKDLIHSLLVKHRFDFIIGSVHHVHTIPIDYDRKMYEDARRISGGTDEKLFETYYDDQYDMLQELRPPIVGHFDLIRLFSDDPQVDMQSWTGVWRKIERNLEFIQSYSGVLELNSAAFRKGMSDPYPSAAICSRFLTMGGRFALSDDSHNTEQVGLNYHRTLEFIREVGIQKIHYVETGSHIGPDMRFSHSTLSSISVPSLGADFLWKV